MVFFFLLPIDAEGLLLLDTRAHARSANPFFLHSFGTGVQFWAYQNARNFPSEEKTFFLFFYLSKPLRRACVVRSSCIAVRGAKVVGAAKGKG